MSAKVTGQVFERYPGGGGEMLLALALADNAHEDGTHIFPSVDTMAKKSRQSVRAVQMHLRRMQEIGWLEVVKNGKGGRGRAAEYRISAAWLKGAELAPFSGTKLPVDNSVKGADIAPFREIKGAKLGTERVQSDALKGAKQSTPYITTITPIEPNTPLTPQGGQAGGGDGQADSGADAGPVDQVDTGAGFADFWAAWPDHRNKQGEAHCLQSWKRKRLHRFAAVIVADVIARLTCEKWQQGYIVAPAKYLKESWWRDTVQPTALAWADTRPGIEAMGLKLGLGRWDEAAWQSGGFMAAASFQAYTAQVKTVFERSPHVAD